MCGIVGYIGNDKAQDIILNGLKKLEYRGYDSAGIVFVGEEFEIVKSIGKIVNLENKLKNHAEKIAFGHTRWATHGGVNIDNCHPHQSQNGKIVLVHNGVIENFQELKTKCNKTFYSQTDTEVIANYLEYLLDSGMDIEKAIRQFMVDAHGSYSLVISCVEKKGEVFAVRNKTPLLIGVGNEFNIVASDALAVYDYTKEVLEVDDMEYAIITENSLVLKNSEGDVIKRDSYVIDIDASDVEKGIYDHYMLKEIYDQPVVLRTLLTNYFIDNKPKVDEEILNAVRDASELHIIASGTSSYAGLVCKSVLEKHLNKRVDVHVASEFAYDTPKYNEGALFIFISQSGETADLRAALVKLKADKMKTLTITNTKGSTLDREADMTMLIYAGREIAVASTKAFVAQVAVLTILANAVSGHGEELYTELSKAAIVIEEIFAEKEKIEEVAKNYLVSQTDAFFIGRASDAMLSLEAALKLKEISYIHAEGFAAGELKHGSIALISEGTPVIGIITQDAVALNTRSNLQEVEARGAKTFVITTSRLAKPEDDFVFDNLSCEVAPIAAVVFVQLLSYYAALHLECDIDMPRNLAKSVTVE